MAPKYVLNYFDAQGNAELARLLFNHAGVEFTDNRIQKADWPSNKSDAGRFPLAQMPTLEVDGRVICQTHAINRYLAREFGLYGANAQESSIIDQLVETFVDVANGFKSIMFNSNLDEEQKKSKFNEFYAKDSTKNSFTFMQELLKRNNGGNGFLVGEKISYGDIHFAYLSTFMEETFLKNYPLLTALKTRVEESPAIKAYIAKRP